MAAWYEELTHWKRFWCWERLRAGGEGDDRGWDGWMASRTRWTWVWGNSGSWWWTGRPGVLQPVESQRVGHDLASEQQLNTMMTFISRACLSFPSQTSYPLNTNCSLLPQPPATTILPSFSVNLTTVGPHISGVISYLSFCDWFLSLGVMLIRLLHHVWIFHFFSQLNNTPQCRYTMFIYLFISWWTLGCFLAFSYDE